MHSSRLLSFAAAAVFLVAPLAACAANACDLLSKEQIGAVANDAITNASGVPNSCIWSGKNTTAYLGIREGGGRGRRRSQAGRSMGRRNRCRA